MNWHLLKDYGVQVFIAVDQLLNALIPPLDGTLSYADETLSARSYRAHRNEHERQNLPSEYRPAKAGFFTSGAADA